MKRVLCFVFIFVLLFSNFSFSVEEPYVRPDWGIDRGYDYNLVYSFLLPDGVTRKYVALNSTSPYGIGSYPDGYEIFMNGSGQLHGLWKVDQSVTNFDVVSYDRQGETISTYDQSFRVEYSNYIFFDRDGKQYNPPTTMTPDMGPFINYYVTDNANLLSHSDWNKILEIEKKFEQNLNMQFFVYTFLQKQSNEAQLMEKLGNQHSPSGRGSFTLLIYKQPDQGNWRVGLGISSYFYQMFPLEDHKILTWDFFGSIPQANNFRVDDVKRFFSNVYNHFVDHADDRVWHYPYRGLYSAFDKPDFFKFDYFYNKDASLYQLKNSKLDTQNVNVTVGLSSYSDTYSDPDIYDYGGVGDFTPFWFWDLGGKMPSEINSTIPPTTTPVRTPIPPSTPNFVSPTPGPFIPGGGDISGVNPAAPGELKSQIEKKLPVTRLKLSFEKLTRLAETDFNLMAPKLTINLNKIFGASTKNIDSTIQNKFVDKETIFVDFAILGDGYIDERTGEKKQITFKGQPVIFYFRGLIGLGMLIWTARYLYNKFIPEKAVD